MPVHRTERKKYILLDLSSYGVTRHKFVVCSIIAILAVVFLGIACLSRRQCFGNSGCTLQEISSENKFTSRIAGNRNATCGITEKKGYMKRLPQCIVIGVRKAGTGAILHFLQLHPDVVIANRELAFFDFYYEKGLEWYRDQFPESYEGQITVEKTSNYFHNRITTDRILKMSGSVKLILVVRDPVERAVSDHLQRKLTVETDVNFPTFEEMVLDPQTSDISEKKKILKPSYYYKHMKRWLEVFPREQIHIVDGENLIKNPYAEVYKMEQFLGLPHCISNNTFVFSAKKGFYCFNKPHRRGYKTHCLPKTKGRKHPDVSPEVIQKLKDHFRPWNEKFYQLIGRRFQW